MNYTYDIYINLNKEILDFFEWNKNDKLIHIKKIPIFKISESNLKKIVHNSIKVDENFIKRVHKKTEVWNNEKNIDNCALFCDNNNIVVIEFNDLGYSYKKSFLYIDEEFEILETITRLKESNIDFEIIKKEETIFKTRKELNNEKFINNEIKKMNKEKLSYIFFECFGKKELNKKVILNKIKHINSNTTAFKKLYDILKLTSTNKN